MPDECKDVLQKTDVSRVDSTMLKIAYLKTVSDQESFESAKKAAGGLSAIFSDIPIGASLSWSDFQNYRNDKLSHTEYRFQDDEAHRLITSFLPDDAVNAWRDCMLRGTSGGLEVYVKEIDPDGEQLTVVV